MGRGLAPARVRGAVAATFFLNGFAFASWAGRIPDVRSALDLTAPGLGLLLFAMSGGSVLTLASSGVILHRLGAQRVVRAAAVMVGVSLAGVAIGVSSLESTPVTAVALLGYGIGTGAWDVAMNVEGAEVERISGRPIMSWLHAAFSLGTVAGAGVAVVGAHASTSLLPHLLPLAVAVSLTAVLAAAGYTGRMAADEASAGVGRAWLEPRTLAIGLLVMVLALTEGTANDWLAVALEDGYDVSRTVAVLGFAGFVTAMTLGRLLGPFLLERLGRVAAVGLTMVLSLVGVGLVVLGETAWLVVPGILLWGVGASLGFPVGMSAAADDPVRAAARVSVVSTIGYTAFLAGPPLLGFVAGEVGTLDALLVLGVLVLCSLPLVRSLRPPDAQRTPAPPPT